MNLKKSRRESIMSFREAKKEILIDKWEDYFSTINMINQNVNLPPRMQAENYIEWLDKNGRIDKYGNYIKEQSA